jgi:hypothetical protein
MRRPSPSTIKPTRRLDQDWIDKAKRLDAGGDLLDLPHRMRARVATRGLEGTDALELDTWVLE